MASITKSTAKPTKVLVVGAGNLEQGENGEAVTKVPIADYLHGQSGELGHTTWFVERSGTWGAQVQGADPHVKGVCSTPSV